MKPNCYLHALSSYVPAEVLTNDDLSKLVETNDEWITTRTGIKRRHRLPQEENASDLGTHAARKALEDAGLDAAKLTHILTATCTPDHLSPSLSCIIGGNIGAGPAMSFDFGSACSGFLYGLHLATASFFQGIGRPVRLPRSFSSAPRPLPAASTGATAAPACSSATAPAPAS